MKRFWICVLALLMLACQPTPKEDAVKQKNTNALIDTVLLEEQERKESGATLPPAQPQATERFICDFTTSTQNVHVTADVPIEVLSETGSFPTLRVEHRYLTESERLTIAGRLFNSDSMYLWEYRPTRAQLEEQIRTYMQEPTDEEKSKWMRETGGTEADWESAQRNRKMQLEVLQKQYAELPEDGASPTLPAWDGSAPDYSEDYEHHRNDQTIVGHETDTISLSDLNYVTVWADEMDRPIEYQIAAREPSDVTNVWFFAYAKDGTERIVPENYGKPHDGASISPNEAAAIVETAFEGIGSFRIADVFWTNNGSENERGSVIVTRRAYFIVLTTDFYGANTPYSSAPVYDVDAESDVVRSWANEALMAAVDGDGNLISTAWIAPLKATDVISESTPMLSKAEIMQVFETQMGRQFAEEMYRDGTLCIDGVQLCLYRIREQNSFDTGLLIPAWFFTGTFTFSESVQGKRASEGLREQDRFDNLNPLLIVNAIDGSVIDPQKGY